jgi:cell wall-associated NlpC family hydrolase
MNYVSGGTADIFARGATQNIVGLKVQNNEVVATTDTNQDIILQPGDLLGKPTLSKRSIGHVTLYVGGGLFYDSRSLAPASGKRWQTGEAIHVTKLPDNAVWLGQWDKLRTQASM